MGRSFWAAIAGATASALTFAAIQEGIGLSIGWLPLQTLLFGLVIAVIVAAILGGSFAALVDSDFKEPVYWFVFAGLLGRSTGRLDAALGLHYDACRADADGQRRRHDHKFCRRRRCVPQFG
jgi:hypothetical protein